jgi:hypothetical protein
LAIGGAGMALRSITATPAAMGGTGEVAEGSIFEGDGFGRLTGREINPTLKGLDIIQDHIATMDYAAYNDMQIARIQGAIETGQKLTGADASFYMHEISENTIMRRMVGGTESEFPELWRQSYQTAHEMALMKYNVSRFTVYHPDVIRAYSTDFHFNYLDFWGISR